MGSQVQILSARPAHFEASFGAPRFIYLRECDQEAVPNASRQVPCDGHSTSDPQSQGRRSEGDQRLEMLDNRLETELEYVLWRAKAAGFGNGAEYR